MYQCMIIAVQGSLESDDRELTDGMRHLPKSILCRRNRSKGRSICFHSTGCSANLVHLSLTDGFNVATVRR